MAKSLVSKRNILITTRRRGLLSNFLRLIAPLVFFAEKAGLRFILDLIVVFFVRIYQKYLSPRKGFSCAYSRLYGDESCSEYFRQIVKSQGINKAIPLFQERLRKCQMAHMKLKTICLCKGKRSKAKTKIKNFLLFRNGSLTKLLQWTFRRYWW
ncbi:membrane protein insertion efficiency factor YidD [Microcoleus sp. A003_D6]|uniref:membrane protein insertion efficiency factor YidD n=1 Tax=Microcoleus sp. A003_D6 TaxID=3055266 RepID=UPI003FA55190